MKKVSFIQDLGLLVTKIRLLTVEELEKYKNIIPEDNLDNNRAISYLGNTTNKPNGIFTEVGVLSYSDGVDTYSRVVLELEGVDKTKLEIGNQFIFEGKLYTLLNNNLAISTIFAKNFDMQ